MKFDSELPLCIELVSCQCEKILERFTLCAVNNVTGVRGVVKEYFLINYYLTNCTSLLCFRTA